MLDIQGLVQQVQAYLSSEAIGFVGPDFMPNCCFPLGQVLSSGVEFLANESFSPGLDSLHKCFLNLVEVSESEDA